MKIGILTFHRTANDGSVLQNWCLHRLLASLSPSARIETIDLRDTRREQLELRRLLSRRPPFFQPEAVRKMMGLRRFLRRNVPLSPSFKTGSLDAARAFIAEQAYDAVVSGSDTVWQINRIGDTEPPHIYFQPGLTGVRKIAFAVSADPISDRSVLEDPQKRDALANAVGDYDFVGVRDEPTRDLVEALGVAPDRIAFTPDPTVLVDFGALVDRPHRAPDGPLLAGIALQSQALARQVSHVLLSRGWQVVNHLGVAPPGAAGVPGRETIGQRLGRFATQDLLITDRFHSSIFTLKLAGAPVIFVESAKKWPEPTSKGRDLLKRLGLEEYVWRLGPSPEVELEPFLLAVEDWRRMPPDMAARFAGLRESAKPALSRLESLLADGG